MSQHRHREANLSHSRIRVVWRGGNWQQGSNVDCDGVHVDCDERDRGEDRDHLWPASQHNVSRAMLEAGRTIVVAAELQPLVYVLRQPVCRPCLWLTGVSRRICFRTRVEQHVFVADQFGRTARSPGATVRAHWHNSITRPCGRAWWQSAPRL